MLLGKMRAASVARGQQTISQPQIFNRLERASTYIPYRSIDPMAILKVAGGAVRRELELDIRNLMPDKDLIRGSLDRIERVHENYMRVQRWWEYAEDALPAESSWWWCFPDARIKTVRCTIVPYFLRLTAVLLADEVG